MIRRLAPFVRVVAAAVVLVLAAALLVVAFPFAVVGAAVAWPATKLAEIGLRCLPQIQRPEVPVDEAAQLVGDA